MLELVPPGRVIFLRPLKTNNARTGWDAVWVKAEEVIREVSACAEQEYPKIQDQDPFNRQELPVSIHIPTSSFLIRKLKLLPPGRVIFMLPFKAEFARNSLEAVWVKAQEVI